MAANDDWEVFDRAPVKPNSVGRGLPVPPLLPTVAILGIALGLIVGSRLAPPPPPTNTPTPYSISTSEPTIELTVPPSAAAGTATPAVAGPIADLDPPADGLTLQGLLAVLAGPGWWLKPSDVTSAGVARYNQVSTLRDAPDTWVWVVVVKQEPGATLAAQCAAGSTLPECSTESYRYIVDYWTGDFIESQYWSHATPAPGDAGAAPSASVPADPAPTV